MAATKTKTASDSGPVSDRPALLITGSTGLIGSRVSAALADWYRVIGLDLEEPEEQTAGADFIPCDLTDNELVGKALAEVQQRTGGELASVIHLAAHYDFSGEPSELYQDLTVDGTRRLMEGLSDFEVDQFVFSSSMLVMKPSEDGQPIEEDSPLQAEWDYPESKVQAERVIDELAGETPTVILRIAGVYGDHGQSIPIVQQVRRIYEKKMESYFFPGNAEHGQSFVHIEDLVDCLCKVVEARDRLEHKEVFMVGEPDVLSYAELQDRIGLVLHGKEWPTIRIPAPVAKAGAWLKEKSPGEPPFIKPWMIDLADSNYPLSVDRAIERLDWRPRHSLRNTLDMMLNRLVEDPASWYELNGLEPPPDLEFARR